MHNRSGLRCNATSAASMPASRCSSSGGNSHPLRCPRALVKTPLCRSPGSGSAVNRTGKFRTHGNKPGMPAVLLSENCNHFSFSSCLARFGSSPQLFSSSWATTHSTRFLLDLANCKARNCCA
eukprot:9064384-Pyramimonas_sp.AAC.2